MKSSDDPGRTAAAETALEVVTLTDGGQSAESVAERLAAWLGAARQSLDLALYDVRLPGPAGDLVADAIRDARSRGVAVRIVYNEDRKGQERFFPPPPHTRPELLDNLGADVRGVPGIPDLMHHKYAVRDAEAVWTGSANWTIDSWSRQENVVATIAHPTIAAAFARNFEELWSTREVDGTGAWDMGEGKLRAWFTPGRGPELSARIAKRLSQARRRIRIASPVLTAGAVLGTLAEIAEEGRVDTAGISDAPQVRQVFHQWAGNPRSRWKGPVLARILDTLPWAGKESAPWTPDSQLHDFMHAKVTVADDHVFLGSFNLSRSGEMNAENVLEVEDGQLADQVAAFIDEIRARHPELRAPAQRAA
jgi:phosphatidylserine/phosphatidylglycerophosphate/cardiolipin synthase-like enzyme